MNKPYSDAQLLGIKQQVIAVNKNEEGAGEIEEYGTVYPEHGIDFEPAYLHFADQSVEEEQCKQDKQGALRYFDVGIVELKMLQENCIGNGHEREQSHKHRNKPGPHKAL